MIGTVSWADNFRAGDTPTVLYMIDPTHDLDDPTQSSWAGKYTRPFPETRPNYWIGITGGHDWDFQDPTKTWENASAVYQARVKTMLNERPEMYAALLSRVKKLYNSAGRQASESNEQKLPEFTGESPLKLEAEKANRKGNVAVRSASDANNGRFVELTTAGSIVWRFNFKGEPAKFRGTIRYRLYDGPKKQELFVNSANLGEVEFDGPRDVWLKHSFAVHLENGPNSVVVRKTDGNIHFDSLTVAP